MIEITSRLPSEYQEVEYIESSGTQYIDTGVVGKNGIKTILDFCIVSGNLNDFIVIGCAPASYQPRFYPVTTQSGKWAYGFNAWKNSSTAAQLNTRYLVETDLSSQSQSMVVNGATVHSTTASDSVNIGLNLYLFGANISGTYRSYGSVMCYSCQIYDGDNLIRDYVPCYRISDNTAGLFDLVNDVFYTNAGTGTFAVGANSNAHTIITITAGGIIPKKWALRRRIMMFEAAGDFAFEYTGNYTDNRDESGIGTVRLTSSGMLTILSGKVTVSARIVGGDAGGAYTVSTVNGSAYGASGGDGGDQTVAVELTNGEYDIIIGAAGTVNKAGFYVGTYYGTAGGDTSAFGYTSTGGGRGGLVVASGGSMTYYAGSAGSPNGTAGEKLNAVASSTAASKCAGAAGYVELTFS